MQKPTEKLLKETMTELSHFGKTRIEILLRCNVSSENKKTDPPSVCLQLFAETYGSNL